MSLDSDILRSTLGSAFAGCMVAVGLSAVLGFQVFLYFRIFPSDALQYKVLVGWIWVLDVVHTVLLCTTMWRYLIVNFGNVVALEEIFPTAAVEISMTAITTLTVNGFYSWRIYKMSRHNWWLIGPIALLSVSQVGFSFTSTVGFISTDTIDDIPHKIQIVFIASLAASAASDILISVARYYYLRNFKQGHGPIREIVDATLVFTINDGFLSCVVAIATVVCCLAMDNSIYLGIYFTISKFYSNSVLATLNLRNWYRHRYAHLVGLSLMRPLTSDGQTVHHGGHSPLPDHSSSPSKHAYPNKINGTVVEVHMQRQVEYDISNLITNDAQANTEN